MFKAFDKLLVPLVVIGIAICLIAAHLAVIVAVMLAVGVAVALIYLFNIRSGGRLWERSNDHHRRRDSRGLMRGLLILGAALLLLAIGAKELAQMGYLIIVALVLFGIVLTTISSGKSSSKR